MNPLSTVCPSPDPGCREMVAGALVVLAIAAVGVVVIARRQERIR